MLSPMLVYEMPLTRVEALKQKSSQYFRRWLGVHRSPSNVGLYSTGSKLLLPLKALTGEYKVTKATVVMILQDSGDGKTSGAGVEVITGHKWQATQVVKEAETRLKQKEIVGSVATGRLGLGCITRSSCKLSNTAERRKLVQQKMRQTEEESRKI